MRWSLARVLMGGWFAGAAAGCGSPIEPDGVQYGDVVTISQPQAARTPAAAGVSAESADPATADRNAPAPTVPRATAAGGSPGPAAASRDATAGQLAAASGSFASSVAGRAAAAAGSGGSGATMTPVGVTSLSFDVTTAPVGGRYQPRNIGAIWVQDSAGRVVKSLEVWARIRGRYLTQYVAARAGAMIDVTATATLAAHTAHHATWNLKDRSGALAPPGKYTLYVEITDADKTGPFAAVDFDTSLGPQALMPPATTNFTAMKLQLQ